MLLTQMLADAEHPDSHLFASPIADVATSSSLIFDDNCNSDEILKAADAVPSPSPTPGHLLTALLLPGLDKAHSAPLSTAQATLPHSLGRAPSTVPLGSNIRVTARTVVAVPNEVHHHQSMAALRLKLIPSSMAPCLRTDSAHFKLPRRAVDIILKASPLPRCNSPFRMGLPFRVRLIGD